MCATATQFLLSPGVIWLVVADRVFKVCRVVGLFKDRRNQLKKVYRSKLSNIREFTSGLRCRAKHPEERRCQLLRGWPRAAKRGGGVGRSTAGLAVRLIRARGRSSRRESPSCSQSERHQSGQPHQRRLQTLENHSRKAGRYLSTNVGPPDCSRHPL